MRPPEFTGGNAIIRRPYHRARRGFNEAAGIHRRKQDMLIVGLSTVQDASMRPPEFTGGNRLKVAAAKRGLTLLQ